MDSETFKSLLVIFLEHLQTEDESALSSAKNIDDAIKLLSNPHTANGLVRKALKKALDFVEKLTDPRDCWRYMEVLQNQAEHALKDLRQALEAKAGKLILSIYCEKPEQIEEVPKWFTDLISNPKSILPGYREVFRHKTEKILEHLGRLHNSDEPVSRVFEKEDL